MSAVLTDNPTITPLTLVSALKRHGIWRHNLNELFSAPFTKAVAASWGATFKADLFGPFDKAITKAVTDLLQEIETTSPVGLQDRIKGQGEACSEEARQTLESIIGAVEKIMSDQQKDINRHIAPHVQSELVDGYDLAMEERGRGSVARQRVSTEFSLQELVLTSIPPGCHVQLHQDQQRIHIRRRG